MPDKRTIPGLTKLIAVAAGASLLRAATVPTTTPGSAEPMAFDEAQYRAITDRLIHAATNNDFGFRRLEQLCDTFGPRFSGSTNLEAALDWVLTELKKDGLENVHSEEVLVPHWVRGEESLELVEPRPQKLRVAGLGGTVATPPEGITAEVLVVQSFDDLKAHAEEAKGRIVLFAMPFAGYGQALPYRSRGATEAAKVGAAASLIRSLTPFSLQTPHTGMMRYEEGVPRIPHAAMSVEDTLLLQRFQDRGRRPVVRLKLGARTLPDAPSRNVLAELVGRERPGEIVVVGGHSDSWDLGSGAMDDAGGCLAAWEALRLLHKLDLRPRRTVRLVLWVNEENGLRGARAYRTNHLAELPQHVLAIESDSGVFRPEGFSFGGSATASNTVRRIASLLTTIGATRISAGGGGADTSPLAQAGIPTMELLTDREKYFWFHHTAADTPDKLSLPEFNQCVAALATMAYITADLPEGLPK